VHDWEIQPATDAMFEEIEAWRYPPPYDFYDGDVDPVLNPERFFEARRQDGELIGFYYFEQRSDEVEYGLGLRPDLAGRGLGLRFVLTGLAFANARYQPQRFVLHVAEFNQRALRVYERAGFSIISRHVRSFDRFGDVPFLTMEKLMASNDACG
jgi:RimJ/RimL family protein N-acetyltransferase